MTQRTRRVIPALLVALGLPWAGVAQVGFSPDITADLGSGPSAVLDDDEVGVDDGAGGVEGPVLPAIPAHADVIGWHGIPNASGDSYLSFDTTIALAGLAAPVEPRDVVRFDQGTATATLVFDGSNAGVPSSAQVDAVSEDVNGEILLSFDTTVALPGGVVADDEDVVRYDGVAFAMVFDGSTAGVATSNDLDGVHDVITGSTLLVSFDTSGSVGGIAYDDEDVLEYDTGLGTFAMFLDASTTDPTDWPSADLVALPEPGRGAALAGMFAVGGLALSRRRASVRSRRSQRGSHP